VDDAALGDAIDRAIEFLVDARNQAGWWRDFFDLSRPADRKARVTGYACDEWVTAYAAAALASTSSDKARRIASEAWELICRRRGPEDGWGYHALLPVDADSTAWALRVAALVGAPDTPRTRAARQFLVSQLQPDGGMACYRRADASRLERFLEMPGPYDGWCAAHTCVTAAAAVLDIGEAPRRYLLTHQELDGRWRGHWWEDDEYATARAVEALCSAADPAAPAMALACDRAAAWAASRIGAAGFVVSCAHGGPSAFATALCVQTIHGGTATADASRLARNAVAWLIGVQADDGSFPASARLRVPAPDAVDPLSGRTDTLIYLDCDRIFTTATTVVALDAARRNRNGRAGETNRPSGPAAARRP
jgi:hypothetical protein